MKVFILFILSLLIKMSFCQANLLDTARDLVLSGEREKSYEVLINGLSAKNSKIKKIAIKKELENLS